MARRGQRQGATRTQPRNQRRGRDLDNEGIIPVLARAVREVEASAERGRVQPSGRTKFQVIALLVREERTRVKSRRHAHRGSAHRAAQAPRRGRHDPGEDRRPRHLAAPAARRGGAGLRRREGAQARDAARRWDRAAGRGGTGSRRGRRRRRRSTSAGWCPQSVKSRQLANPFLTPDFSNASSNSSGARLLASWELLGPLFRAFEEASGGVSSCMDLPEPTSLKAPHGLELMKHQAQVVAAAAAGHRTFLLADEPGLGKTAQALLAAQAAHAFPLLAVVPNVVKTNWAREAGPVDAEPSGHRDPRRRRHDRRLRRHRGRQLRGARPPRRLARRHRLPQHGGRRGALHQEQGRRSARSTCSSCPTGSGPAPRGRC